MSIEEKFNAAVNVIRSLPKNGSYQPSHELMLSFYSYFKQATEGPNNTPKPSFWEVVKKAKWEAWAKLGNLSKEDSMLAYVDLLNKIVETMAYTENVADFLSSSSNDFNLSTKELELCAGETLEKVKSSPQRSPSSDSSPERLPRLSDGDEAEDEDEASTDGEDEFFLDTAEHLELEKIKEAPSLPLPMMGNGSVKTYIPNGKYREPDLAIVNEALQKAAESLRKELKAVEEKINILERRQKRKVPSGLFSNLSTETAVFIVLWPIAVHAFMAWYSRRKQRA